MAEKSFYEVLGVGPDATIDEVRAAYERLSAGAGSKEQLAEAFQTLSDPLKRAKYDMSLEVREKPASEQVQTIEPSWTGPAIATLAVAIALGAGFYYYDQQVDAREAAEKAAAEAAAAKARLAEERIKAADLATQEREARRQSEEQAIVEESFRNVEKRRRQEEAARLAELEKARQKESEDQLERQQRMVEDLNRLKALAGNVPTVPLKDK